MVDRVIKVTLRGDFGDLNRQLAATSTQVKTLANDMGAFGSHSKSSMAVVGDAAGKVGLVAAAGLGLATKAAMDWETAWAGVTKTVDGSTAEMAELEQGLRDLAKTLPATHEEIAAVAEAAGQLGVAREDIVSFTKTMVDLGETTNLTADEAATSIAQMANVMGTAPEEIDNLGAALVALGNDGASTEKQIIEMAQRISGAGAQIGLAESDILAIANASASMGVEVEAGGTAISQTFTEMAKATKQGGDALDQFAATAGMSSEQFVEAFEADPAQAFATFIAGLRGINETGGDVFTTLDGLGLSGIRVSQSLLGLAASGDLLTDSLALGSKAWKENTALTDEAGNRYGTTASKAQVAINGIRDNMIDLGDTALPIVAEVSEAVTNITGVFGGLPGPIKKVVTSLLAVTAVTGGGLWFGTKVVGSVTKTRQALDDLGATGVRTGRMLRTGLAVGAVVVGLDILDKTLDSLLNRDIDQSKLGRSMDSLAQGRIAGELAEKFGTDLEDFGSQIAQATAGGLKAFQRSLPNFIGDNPFDKSEGPKQAAENIRKIDQELAALVEGGRGEEAAKIFDSLTAAAVKQGTSAEVVAKGFSEYELAVANAAAEGKNAGEETGRTAEEVKALAKESGIAAEQITKMSEAEIEAAEASREVAQEFVGLGEHVDNADVSLKDWIRSLEIQAKALEDFKDNAIEAGKKGLSEGLITELEAAGPAGALRMEELADASEEEIRKANIAWRKGQNAIADYVAMQVPAKDIEVNTDDAISKLTRVQQYLNDINSWNPTTNVPPPSGIELYPGIPLGPPTADGGTIGGNRYPYGDKVLTPTAPGEFITSNRYGQADMNRAALEAGNRGAKLQVVGGMADGGTVGNVSGRSYAAAPGVTVYFPTPAQMSSAVRAANLIAAANAAAAVSAGRMAVYTAATARSGTEIHNQYLDNLNAQRRIRDLKRDLAARDDKGRLELRGLDRTIAKAELDAARRELTAIRNQGRSAKAEARRERERARKEARDDALRAQKEARADAIRALKEQRTDVTNTLTGSADIFARGVRPAGAVAEVNRQIADIAEYGNVIARLKGAGASPALLSQIVAKAEAGDFRSAIRLGQALLSQPATLSKLNSALGTLGQVSAAVAGVTTDPRFLAAGSWNPGSTAITKTVNVNIGADPSQWKLELQRYIQHTVSEQLQSAGI